MNGRLLLREFDEIHMQTNCWGIWYIFQLITEHVKAMTSES